MHAPQSLMLMNYTEVLIMGVQTAAFILFLGWYSVMETDAGGFCTGAMLAVGAVL